jgi:hypothetical protein
MITYRVKTNEFIHTSLGKDTILMNTTDSSFVEINETSTFLVDLLRNAPLSEADLVEATCREYNISAEDCSADITEALQALVGAGLLDISVN